MRLPNPSLGGGSSRNGGPRAAPSGSRATWWGTDEAREVDVYDGEKLLPGDRVPGPSIVELPTTTVVVYPGWDCEVTGDGAFMLEHVAANGEERN